jgi:cbb3-type cytochrome oxidase subunit 3
MSFGMTTMETVLAAGTILFLIGMFIGVSVWVWRNARSAS